MYSVDKFKIEIIKENQDYGEYIIGPLPKGYGLTLSNLLRRILLSSIEGAAVTSVKINGVKHEYSTIPGMMDDVITFLLRLKKVPIKCYSNEPQKLEIHVKGNKKVTSGDIKCTSEVEIFDKDIVLTELTDAKAELNMEITVEKGIGYLASDENKRAEVGMIPLDSNFSPVKRVVVNIQKTRVGKQTDLDQIHLTIYTNGAISPKESLNQSVEIFKKLSTRFEMVVEGKIEEEEEVKKESVDEKKSTDLDIDKLNLSARLTNSLLKAGIKNLMELQGKTLDEIMSIRGLGQKSADELLDIMHSYKLEIVK